jgi:hypothetical protein
MAVDRREHGPPVRLVMTSSKSDQVTEYLRRARLARQNAEEAVDEDAKLRWLKLAEQWTLLAEQTARGPMFDPPLR